MEQADQKKAGAAGQPAAVTPLPHAHQPDLLAAMRRARLEDAERTLVGAELRAAEIGRLENLRLKLAPLFAQVDATTALFDHGLVASETPRLFIDMIAFVEMARDRKTYVFVQETRNGRVILATHAAADNIVAAVTDYVARRLVERERALAGLALHTQSAPATPAPDTATRPPPAFAFSDVLAVYAAGAVAGAAIVYAGLKIGWFG